MAIVIVANTVLFAIIGSLCVGIGIDLKKRSSWFLGLYAFISGFLIGFARSDSTGGYRIVTNLTGSLQAGLLFAFMFMFGGAMIYWNKQTAEKYLVEMSEKKSIFGIAVPPKVLARIHSLYPNLEKPQNMQMSETKASRSNKQSKTIETRHKIKEEVESKEKSKSAKRSARARQNKS